MLTTPASDSVCPESDSSQPDRSATRPSTREILAGVRISDVCQALTGIEPRRTGRDTWRVPATWRGGEGLTVSGDDSRGVWHDFKTDAGGGVLDLVIQVRGGTRTEALRFVADLAGGPMDDTPLAPEDKAIWAAERRQLERDLPTARYWQRAAVSMAEELLDTLKAAAFDPISLQPQLTEIRDIESMLASLRRKDGLPLVQEFSWWLQHHAGPTAAMVASAKRLERAQRWALLAYLRETDPGRAAT